MPKSPQKFPAANAAEKLGVTRHRISELYRAGLLPNSAKFGDYENSPILVDERDIDNYIKTRLKRGAKKEIN